MLCRQCHSEIPSGLRFCSSCVTPLPATCSQCGQSSPGDFSFCGHCGAALSPPASSDRRAHNDHELIGSDADRRQMTVMFCDLVGSTALSQKLDPEDLRDLIAAFRKTCADAVRQCGGWIARYLGDGMLVYFGYPSADENSPEMAVRAALRIIVKLREGGPDVMYFGSPLQARIGVHTGLVVAGDLPSGNEREAFSIVGETPNIAARLQSIADPQTILISETTYALVRHRFECRELGQQHLRGTARPVRVFEPVAERLNYATQDAFELRDLTPLAGREKELAVLVRAWAEVKEDSGRALLISGEPGIGKSRLIHAFHSSLEGGCSFIACNCAAHCSDSAFYPIIDLLHRYISIDSSDGNHERLRKIANALEQSGLPSGEALPFLGPLLSIPAAVLGSSINFSPLAWREKTIDLLVSWIMKASERRPMILVVEDLHWADPSTLETIARLVSSIPRAKLLLIVTSRQEFNPEWTGALNVSNIDLARLAVDDAKQMIDALDTRAELSDEVRSQLIERTDGVPLFLEELTKAFVETKLLDGNTDNLQRDSGESIIPSTLRDFLMARLDRLHSVKRTAQIASTLGREFRYDLLLAVSSMPENDLCEALSQLVVRELLFQRGVPPRSTYFFKHALIQEAAYQSLLRSARRHYHRMTADVLTNQFPDIANQRPELVAHHFSLGGADHLAVPFWQTAGERALERYANAEALAHLRKALTAVEHLADLPERAQQEATLLASIGTAVTALKGWAAPEAETIYSRARILCQALGDTHTLAAALRGLQSYFQVRGPLRAARQVSRQLLELAQRGDDRSMEVEAKRAFGWCLFCLGELGSSKRFLENAVRDYDPEQSKSNIRAYGSDAGVAGLSNLAWLEWSIGNSRRAIERSDEAIRLARALGHPLSLTYALCMSAAVYQGLQRPDIAQSLASSTVQLGKENSLSYWCAWGTIIHGWTICEQGHIEEGIAEINRGISAYRATGANLFNAYALGLLSDACAKAGKACEGITHVNEAIASAKSIDMHIFDAELLRIKAALLVQTGAPEDLAAAELRKAVKISHHQGAKMLELKARTALFEISARTMKTPRESTRIDRLLAELSEDSASADPVRIKEHLASSASASTSMPDKDPA
jgi:class 3 adenylate cyclase/predicted ATPase